MAPEMGVVSLVGAAQRGDTLAMADLLDHLTPIVGRICGPIALADGPDAAQESLIIIMRSLRTLRDPGALYGWVRMIAVRESIRTAKRARRDQPSSLDTLVRVPGREDAELRVNLRGVLDRLSPEHRAVLVLRDVEGFDETDAAALLRVPTGTVKSRLHRARAHFKKEWIP